MGKRKVSQVVISEGTAADPLPAGTPVGDDVATLVLGAPVVYTTYKADNQYNHDPRNGQYVSVPVTITNIKAAKLTPWADIRLTFVSTNGRAFPPALVTGQAGALMEFGALCPGGVVQGVVTFDAPADVAGAKVSVRHRQSREVFVTL